MKFLLIIFFNLSTLLAHTIIPQPQFYQPSQGTFTLSSTTPLVVTTKLADNAIDYLQKQLSINSKYQLLQQKESAGGSILFKEAQTIQKEGYRLHVASQKIIIEASSTSGFFYGVITLMQLMQTQIYAQSTPKELQRLWHVSCCHIEDAPRFQWRGMMLDSARNFFSLSYVKKFIDRMAQQKLNVFHWHLSDDEGWRIEIKKYPLLTQVGSKRGPNTKLPFSLYPTLRGPKKKMQEGYYTQEEMKEIVAYASKRSVHILPEIDVPAHSKAAVVAYPQLLQDPQDRSQYTSVQKISQNTIDVGLESSYQFLDNIIEELTVVFPFEYIHVGGDEVPKGAWKESPSIKKLMKREQLQSLKAVHAYFFTRLDAILKKHQRKLIAWQEVRLGTPTLRQESIIMAWRGDGVAIKAAKKGEHVILSPAQFLYFDQKYTNAAHELGHTWAGPTDTKEVYSYTPISKKLSKKEAHFIKGIHACLWSETALNEQIADYLAWPRVFGLSEVAWTAPKKQHWKDFERRLVRGGLKRLKQQNIHYRPYRQNP